MSERIEDWCPSMRCRGKSPKLYVNREKAVFYCFRCGYKGKLDKLAPINCAMPEIRPKVSTSAPPEAVSLRNEDYNWLVNDRGLSPAMMSFAKPLSCDKGILFRFPDSEYWQIRNRQTQEPKWINPKEALMSKKTGLTYDVFLHEVPGDGVVWLVEGIFDALKIGEYANCSAVLGSTVSEAQAERLSRIFMDAVICFDRDVPLSNRVKEENKLRNFFRYVRIYHLPQGVNDPGELSQGELRRMFCFR